MALSETRRLGFMHTVTRSLHISTILLVMYSNSGYAQTSLGNEDLKWETSYQYNAGVDAEFWKGALAVSLDYFYKVTEDMLVKAPNPPSTGYAESAWINSGSVLNTGVELEATLPANKKGLGLFRWW